MKTYFIYFWFKTGRSRTFEIFNYNFDNIGNLILLVSYKDFSPKIFINMAEVEYFVTALTQSELEQIIPV